MRFSLRILEINEQGLRRISCVPEVVIKLKRLSGADILRWKRDMTVLAGKHVPRDVQVAPVIRLTKLSQGDVMSWKDRLGKGNEKAVAVAEDSGNDSLHTNASNRTVSEDSVDELSLSEEGEPAFVRMRRTLKVNQSCINLDWECPICAVRMASCTQLEDHMQQMHQLGEKSVCPICKARFSRFRKVFQHLISKHTLKGRNMKRTRIRPLTTGTGTAPTAVAQGRISIVLKRNTLGNYETVLK